MSNESNFSYNWSVNMKTLCNFDSMEYEDEESAFIEMDPSLSPSKRFSNVNQHDFNFAICYKEEEESITMKNNIMVDPSSTLNSNKQVSVHKRSSRVGILLFQKLWDFVKKISSSVGCKSGNSTKVEEAILMKKWESSEATSSLTPRTSIANYSEDDWRRSCDSEASIYEAVLHCKRTINGDE